MASCLIIKVNTPILNKFLTQIVTPQLVGFFVHHLDGVLDDVFGKRMHDKDAEIYIGTTYGKKQALRVLVFFGSLPPTSACLRLRTWFPGISLVLFTNDIHDRNYNGGAPSVHNCDRVISMTTAPCLFQTFLGVDVTPKLIHSGNRCPDEFTTSEPNFSSIDALFYYGTTYDIRKEFLGTAGHHWEVIQHRRSSATDTAKQMQKYTYAFTTGYDYTRSRAKSDVYYLVAKFFEITGSGCLLLCDHRGVQQQLSHHGFLEGEHYLNINRENSAEVNAFVKNHPDKVRDIRTRAHALVTSKYTIKKACEKINVTLRSL